MNVLSSTPQPCLKPVTVFIAEDSKDDLAQYDQEVWHLEYNCPLHTWLSETSVRSGKPLSEQQYILYIEYRDHCRASRYQEYNFPDLISALEFQRHQVQKVSLHKISPTLTRRFPIKVS